MRVRYLIILIFMLSACYAKALYTKKQYIEMNDDEIRTILLKHTPVGTSKKEVEHFIKKEVEWFPGHIERKVIGVSLASYNDGNMWKGQPASTVVFASWYFDDDGKLIDIGVERIKRK